MKRIFTSLSILAISLLATAQESEEILPRFMTEAEKAKMGTYSFPQAKGIETPPPFQNLRTMAEWEEIQALTITWEGFPGILKQITRAAMEETMVIIFSENPTSTENYLMGNAAGGPLPGLENVQIVDAPTNSIWIRDYGANSVYINRVDTLMLVDWIYNRPRPADDVLPDVLDNVLGLDLYTTTSAPNDLVNTGGNFMSDGQGTAFASELILAENEVGNEYQVSPKTEEEIDAIMNGFQGISRFVKMPALPYDIINHIDMHMKLLDEKTLLVGSYPEGIADGPQINANIDYVVNNFLSSSGEEYEVHRIPMPDDPNGDWPDDFPDPAPYRTYTNGVFVNNTFIYPSYREEYDTTAARIYEDLLPGYNLVPIDCDDPGSQIIFLAGAIHCITHSVGVSDPMLIVHNSLADTEDDTNPYEVMATVEHRSGIASSTLHWRLAGDDEFSLVEMTPGEGVEWLANIPGQSVGSVIEYYVSAVAENGKTQVRPIVAPEGFWTFEVLGTITSVNTQDLIKLANVYPNPATDLVSIPINAQRRLDVTVYLTDITGKVVKQIHSGELVG
ncbi:MAG: agmatine deiminase family protein, partial [Cryomorphaceae bacterium]